MGFEGRHGTARDTDLPDDQGGVEAEEGEGPEGDGQGGDDDEDPQAAQEEAGADLIERGGRWVRRYVRVSVQGRTMEDGR